MADTPDQPIPLDAQIYELKVDPEYKDRAFETIKNQVKGNKYNPEDVKLEAFEGKVLRFSAHTLMTLVVKREKTIKPGRYESAKKVESEEGANIEMDNAYKALDKKADLERSTREILLNRKDKGFGVQINNTYIQLPALRKEFVIFEACKTCKANGTVPCLPCNGNGRVTCTRCKGTRRVKCTHCQGARMVAVPGDATRKQQCPVCHGQGYSGCPMCKQTGYIPCKTCASRGVTQCPNCQGTAWNSHVFTQDIQAKTNFYYSKEKLPEKVAVSMEERSTSLTEHAIIRIITDNANLAQWKEIQAQLPDPNNPFNNAMKEGDICYPILYDVTLPYGHIEYTINNKSYYTFLFGQKAVLDHVSPFLDDLIANGLRKLKDAAELRGDVHANLKAAGEYRTIKEGIIFTATASLKKARVKLKSANPLGLSDGALKEIIILSDRALKNITKKPRIIGTIIAGLAYLALFSGYFLTPVRSTLLSNIPNTALHSLADAVILGAAAYIGMIGIQSGAQNALKKTMNMLLPSKIKTAPPKLGKIIYWNAATTCAAFLAIVEASRHVASTAPPEWYTAIMSALPI